MRDRSSAEGRVLMQRCGLATSQHTASSAHSAASLPPPSLLPSRIPHPQSAAAGSSGSVIEHSDLLGYGMSKLIAISATADTSKIRLSLNYARSIEGAGLVPLVVPPLTDPTRAGEILDSAGGLLLTGGEDVDPARYGAAPHPAARRDQPAARRHGTRADRRRARAAPAGPRHLPRNPDPERRVRRNAVPGLAERASVVRASTSNAKMPPRERTA